MKVMMKTGSVKNVDREVAQNLIIAGLANEYVEPIKQAVPDMKFWAKRGPSAGIDYEYPPAVFHRCASCGTSGYTAGPNGNSHLVKVFHCGQTDVAPQEVADEYLRLFAAWKARSRKSRVANNGEPIPSMSASTDKRFQSPEQVKNYRGGAR